MAALVRKFGLFYLGHTVTFFFLCAYSLAASAPNFPYLPAMFFPIYLSSAVAMSERETGDPLLGILPITPGEIIRVKFLLALVLVVVGWLSMSMFTTLQGLSPQMTQNVMKLNTLSCIYTLLLAGAFQLGIHFFGWSLFQKALILFIIVSAVFSIIFFIGLAERGNNHPDLFPLVPFLETLPVAFLVFGAGGACLVYYYLLREGPWNRGQLPAG